MLYNTCLNFLHRVNQCITSQTTDFEQSILAQANDKWKPLTLAEGAFDLEELKKDISSADAKFSVRRYKPTSLILEYLVSRAAKQGVAVPSFATAKPNSGKLSAVQLKTANALRSDFKEAGNDSSTTWSMSYGMMIQKTWKRRLTGETP